MVAQARDVTLRLNLSPGDTSRLKRAFGSASSDLSRIEKRVKGLFGAVELPAGAFTAPLREARSEVQALGDDLERVAQRVARVFGGAGRFDSALEKFGGRAGARGEGVGNLPGAAGPDLSGAALTDYAAKWQKVQDATSAVHADLDAQERSLARLNAGTDPQILRRRAALENATDAARDRHDRDLHAERRRQWNPETVFGRLAKRLGGGPERTFLGESLGKSFGAAGKEFGSLVGAVAKVAGPVGLVVGGFAALAAGTVKAHQAIAGMIGAMAEAARVSDPVMWRRYERALADRAAATGRVFEPVLYGVTKLEETLGDFANTVIPKRDEMAAGFAAMDEAVGELRGMLRSIAPDVKTLVRSGFDLMAESIRALTTVAKLFIVTVRDGLPGLGVFLGSGGQMALGGTFGASAPDLESARGLAPARAHFGGQDEVARQIYASAFGSGHNPAGQKSAAERTAEGIARVVDYLRKWDAKPEAAVARALGGSGADEANATWYAAGQAVARAFGGQ